MKAQLMANPDLQRARILRLNVLQTWLGVIGAIIATTTAVAAVLNGWVGLPAKVDEIQRQQQIIADKQSGFGMVTNRVNTIEDTQRQMWTKLSSDHDLLLGINQKLTDMDERQKETAQDVKDLKK